jgi:pimeloyl-ACP methyl ester carboxylesterase
MDTSSMHEQRVDIGGYALYMRGAGTGSPSVIMDAGGTDTAESWATILPSVARFTYACAYDRAGLGRSERGPVPTTSEQIVNELHRLLSHAHMAGPYVLVGHSFGGLNTRLYAHLYPDEVAGMVLVDPAHEDMYASMDTTAIPTIDFEASAQQVKACGEKRESWLLIVLSHGLPVPYLPEEVTSMWLPCHKRLARLSSNSIHVIVPRSGHFMQADQPDIVIEAIRQVVEAVRRQPHTLQPCEEVFSPVEGICVSANE